MENIKVLIVYAIYLPVVIAMTFFVSKSLFKNGKIFMIDIFSGKEEIALSTNRLFEIGFYLINVGFAFFIMEVNSSYVKSYQDLIEVLSGKIGGFSIYLGFMLFFNLFLFLRGRKKSREHSPEKGSVVA